MAETEVSANTFAIVSARIRDAVSTSTFVESRTAASGTVCAFGEPDGGVAAEDAVRRAGEHAGGAGVSKRGGAGDEGLAAVDDVVDQNGCLPCDGKPPPWVFGIGAAGHPRPR